MTYVIAEPCVSTCDTACVEADGFDPEGKQLYIDPDECIDCGACEPECPVEAIFEESELPEEWNKYTEINAKWFS